MGRYQATSGAAWAALRTGPTATVSRIQISVHRPPCGGGEGVTAVTYNHGTKIRSAFLALTEPGVVTDTCETIITFTRTLAALPQ